MKTASNEENSSERFLHQGNVSDIVDPSMAIGFQVEVETKNMEEVKRQAGFIGTKKQWDDVMYDTYLSMKRKLNKVLRENQKQKNIYRRLVNNSARNIDFSGFEGTLNLFGVNSKKNISKSEDETIETEDLTISSHSD